MQNLRFVIITILKLLWVTSEWHNCHCDVAYVYSTVHTERQNEV